MTVETFITSASGKKTITKSPRAVLDYAFDWTDWLSGNADTITGHVVEVDTESGIVRESSTLSVAKVIAIISGGTLGATGWVRCRITTAGGRVDERTFFIKIKER